jgi:hypothetical protein
MGFMVPGCCTYAQFLAMNGVNLQAGPLVLDEVQHHPD